MNVYFFNPFIKKGMQEKDLFAPHFDKNGLLTAVVTCKKNGDLLMVAHMNADAVNLTLESGIAHFWSRSRKTLWKKGETSGNFLQIKEIFIDCDQDVLWLKVFVAGEGVVCHTGERSCFYRQLQTSTNKLASM